MGTQSRRVGSAHRWAKPTLRNLGGSLVLPIILVCLSMVWGIGCQSAQVQRPLTADLSANDSHTRTEFWYQLANRPVTSNDDALHALLLYMDSADPSPDYAARVATLKQRGIIPVNFDQPATQAADRGDFAVALVHALDIHGGVTMALTGATPRYAVRALVYRGIYPDSSPNQGLSGGEFVGIMQKAEEYQRGSPADAPAVLLPNEIPREGTTATPLSPLADAQTAPPIPPDADLRDGSDPSDLTFAAVASDTFAINPGTTSVVAMSIADAHPNIFKAAEQTWFALSEPLYMDDLAATAPAGPRPVNVIITGLEGTDAEVRKSPADPWVKARRGMVLHASAEFRTGANSAIRFIIPPDQTFCIDSQTTISLAEATQQGNKMKTDVELAHGRVRYDVAKIPTTAPAQGIVIEQAGLEHDAIIRSANSALALRGTKVSLFEQESFAPQATSLTGRAIYINTRGERIPFGGGSRADIGGSQTSAAQHADVSSLPAVVGTVAENDFLLREIDIVTQRGGFIRGDVIVGDLHLSDFHNHLPGALDFVLQWSGGPQQTLNDLNLAVFSPLNTTSSPDFVANPPFTVSLNPGSPASQKLRATNYPQTSRSGGQISANSVGPDGLELAFWPKNYPVGTYKVVVFNLVDAVPPPTSVTNPVTYTIDVFLNGQKLINTFTGSVGLLQTSAALAVPVPASGSGQIIHRAVQTTPPAPRWVTR